MFSPIAKLHFLYIDTHTTHNSPIYTEYICILLAKEFPSANRQNLCMFSILSLCQTVKTNHCLLKLTWRWWITSTRGSRIATSRWVTWNRGVASRSRGISPTRSGRVACTGSRRITRIRGISTSWRISWISLTKYDKEKETLTLYTLISVCIISILFFIHFLGCWQGEFN